MSFSSVPTKQSYQALEKIASSPDAKAIAPRNDSVNRPIFMIDTNYCYKKNDSILYKELADGPVLIDPYRRTLISLNPAALEIWRLLDGQRPVSGIVAALRDMFDVDEKELEKDTSSFLKELIKREMIR